MIVPGLRAIPASPTRCSAVLRGGLPPETYLLLAHMA